MRYPGREKYIREEPAWPRTVTEVSAAWLESVMGSRVASFHVARIDDGVLADLCRVTVSFRDGEPADEPGALRDGCAALPQRPTMDQLRAHARAGLPVSLVMKVSKSIPTVRGLCVAMEVYDREVNFYNRLIDEMPVRTPACYGVWKDGPEFCIVLEDLALHNKVFNIVTRCPSVAQLKEVASEAAKLHAKFFQHPLLESDPLIKPWARETLAMDMVVQAFPVAYPVSKEKYLASYKRTITNGHEPLDKMFDAMTADPARCVRFFDVLHARLASRPRTFIHFDTRCDNVFDAPSPGGGAPTYTFVDWQLYIAGPPAIELGQLMQMTLRPEDAHHAKEIEAHYYQRLCELNPSVAEAYTAADLREDYKLVLIWFYAFVSAFIAESLQDLVKVPSQEALWGAIFLRMPAMLMEYNVVEAWATIWAEVA